MELGPKYFIIMFSFLVLRDFSFVVGVCAVDCVQLSCCCDGFVLLLVFSCSCVMFLLFVVDVEVGEVGSVMSVGAMVDVNVSWVISW